MWRHSPQQLFLLVATLASATMQIVVKFSSATLHVSVLLIFIHSLFTIHYLLFIIYCSSSSWLKTRQFCLRPVASAMHARFQAAVEALFTADFGPSQP